MPRAGHSTVRMRTMMKDLMSGSYLSGGNAAYIDELY
jgi:hypothetical protein